MQILGAQKENLMGLFAHIIATSAKNNIIVEKNAKSKKRTVFLLTIYIYMYMYIDSAFIISVEMGIKI